MLFGTAVWQDSGNIVNLSYQDVKYALYLAQICPLLCSNMRYTSNAGKDYSGYLCSVQSRYASLILLVRR